VGGIITLSYPAFFGATNRWAQTLMTATLAALVALALLLALAMDYPFTGDEKISVQPFDEARPNAPEFADSLGCKALGCSFSCRLGRSAGLCRAARFVSVGDHHGKLPFSVAIGAIMKKTIDS
jgi:hypothetical protein